MYKHVPHTLAVLGLVAVLTAPTAWAGPPRPWSRAWTKAKVRAWDDYPFVEAPSRQMRTALWQDFDELPAWAQRGNIRYFSGGHSRRRLERIKQAQGVAHSGPIRPITEEHCRQMEQMGVPLIIRLDGQFFWGRNYTQIMETIRGGGWAAYHSTVPNTRWFFKYPPSKNAAKVLRDGAIMIEYYGSKWVQRRDVSYLHPETIRMRDAFLRECCLGEQVFPLPLDLKVGGHVAGVWWDNPGNVCVSYDAYANEWIARAFREKFGDRYSGEKYKGDRAYACDPPHFWMKYHDREVQRWYEKLWADAYAGYYAWQYKFLQDEIAPKLGRAHLFVGGNSKLNWPNANWDYYLYSWPDTYDVLGPNETNPVYTDKEAPGLKLALAASNGKPAGIWRSPRHGGYMGEMLTCLGVATNPNGRQVAFQLANKPLYHNAMPGGRVAVLYHLLDGVHQSPIANHARICDQVWRAGTALEVITELHLSKPVLDAFDVVIVPGFRFSDEEIAALKAYAQRGGKLLLIGDNRDHEDRPLSERLADLPGYADGQKALGKGLVRNFGTQLITQRQMNAALNELGGLAYRITAPAGKNLMLNVLAQPKDRITTVHVVNYTGRAMQNVRVRVPAAVATKHAAVVDLNGQERAVDASGGTVTLEKLGGYAVIVLCPTAAARDRVLTANAEIADRPLPDDLGNLRGGHKRIAAQQIEPGDVRPGQRIAHLRQCTRVGFHRVDADVVTAGTGRVGQAQPIRLKLHAIGIWAARHVQFDKVKFVAVNVATGERQEIPVQIAPVAGTAEGEEMRQQKDFTIPAGTFVLRETTTDWTPTKPGRYQLYLGYRYNSSVFDGKPGEPLTKGQHARYQMGDYMFSRPFRMLRYEDRLPCLVVDVAGKQPAAGKDE